VETKRALLRGKMGEQKAAFADEGPEVH